MLLRNRAHCCIAQYCSEHTCIKFWKILVYYWTIHFIWNLLFLRRHWVVYPWFNNIHSLEEFLNTVTRKLVGESPQCSIKIQMTMLYLHLKTVSFTGDTIN